MKYYEYRNSIDSSTSLAFGCSHTWGIGVECHESWPYLLSAKNYGVPGTSADHLIRTAQKIIPVENPNTIFVLWPDWRRFEYTENNQYHQSLPSDKNRIEFMQTHNENWCASNFANQVKKMHDLCLDQQIKLIDMTLYDLLPYMDHSDRWPLSKLGHHYAPEWHKQVADLFLWAKNNNHIFPLSYE
jgi:hypothetical protein